MKRRGALFGGDAAGVFRGMATLALGTGAARIIGVASIPLLTRIYSPEDYGVLSVFTSVVLILVPVLSLSYVVAIPLPRQDKMAINLVALTATLMLAMAFLLSLFIWSLGPALLGILSMDVLAPYWWLIALGIVGTGSYELLIMWATRRKAYRQIAETQVYQSVIGEALKIGLGLLALKPLGLLIGQVAAQCGAFGSLVTRFQSDFQRNVRAINIRRMVFLAKYFRGFPIYRLPSQLLLAFSTQAPLLFTAALYDAETTGQLGLALLALALPVNILGQSMSKAYYAEVAQISKKAPRKILDVTRSVQRKLFAIGAPLALLLILLGPELFAWVFGKTWYTAGHFASILSIYILLQLTSAPLMQVLGVFNEQRMFLIINAARGGGLVFLFVISRAVEVSATWFTILYSLFMTIFYVSVTILIMWFLRTRSETKRSHGFL